MTFKKLFFSLNYNTNNNNEVPYRVKVIRTHESYSCQIFLIVPWLAKQYVYPSIIIFLVYECMIAPQGINIRFFKIKFVRNEINPKKKVHSETDF